MSEDKQRVLKLLEEKGQDSTFKEFKEVYEKFKNHPEAVAALRRGVDRQSKTVDSGSYCEEPSRDYNDWWNKNNFFKKMDLEDDRAFLDNDGPEVLRRDFSKVKTRTADIPAIFEKLESIEERLTRLEKRLTPKPEKYKL